MKSAQEGIVAALPAIERRMAAIEKAELREHSDRFVFEGRAAVFNKPTRIDTRAGSFDESIQRGAYRKLIDSGSMDVVFAPHHDETKAMARSTVPEGPGSLVLSESPKGLEVYAELVPTADARTLKQQMDAKVVNDMSFRWPKGAVTDLWSEGRSGMAERSITQFSALIDVGPVVFPAYEGTTASMRSRVCGIDIVSDAGEVQEDLVEALGKRVFRGDLTVTEEERSALDSAYVKAGRVSPWVLEIARRTLGVASAETVASTADTEARDGSARELGHVRLAAVNTRLIDRRLRERGVGT